MVIRKAAPEDATEVAELLIEAAHGFIEDSMGTGGKKLNKKIFRHNCGFMNYQNCFIAEVEGKTAGMMMVYTGAQKKKEKKKYSSLSAVYQSKSVVSSGSSLAIRLFPIFQSQRR